MPLLANQSVQVISGLKFIRQQLLLARSLDERFIIETTNIQENMNPGRNDIAKIVLETLHELGEDLDIEELKVANEHTRLFGTKSALDSINLVNFIADAEERISDELKIEIVLANQSAISRTHSPFRQVSSCIDYIMELITNDAS